MPEPVGRPPFSRGPEIEFRSRHGIDTVPRITSLTPNNGRLAGGLTVTISGANFRNQPDGTAPTVKFGTLIATGVVVVSSTQLTCVTPASTTSGLVDVSVTIQGQIGTLYQSFNYIVSAITSISPAYGPLAGGTNVIITGYNFLIGSTITFGGVDATNVVFIDDQHFACTTPAHAVGFTDVVITEP